MRLNGSSQLHESLEATTARLNSTKRPVGEEFGGGVCSAGDVDGFADLIVGTAFDDNNGTDSSSARAAPTIDGSILYSFEGNAGENFGDSVEGRGDGVDDFVVSTRSLSGGIVFSYESQFVSQISAPILGDCNLDGDVDFSDIPALIAMLHAGTLLEEADANEDGAVNFSDINPFVEILSGNKLPKRLCPLGLI